MFHAAERRHAGPFWARRRRLPKNELACITGKLAQLELVLFGYFWVFFCFFKF